MKVHQIIPAFAVVMLTLFLALEGGRVGGGDGDRPPAGESVLAPPALDPSSPEADSPPAPAPAAGIAGSVSGENGEPVEGADITVFPLLPLDTRSADPAPTAVATTDARGRFSLLSAPPGVCSILARKAGSGVDFFAFVEVGSEEVANLRFRLRRGAAISGTVTDDQGRPLASARVVILAGRPVLALHCRLGLFCEEGADDAPVLTGPDGRFDLPDLLPGPQLLRFRAPNRQDLDLPIRAPAVDVQARLLPGGALRGRIVFTGPDIPESVQVWSDTADLDLEIPATGAVTPFTLPGLEPGLHRVSAIARGTRRAHGKEWVVAGEDSRDVVLELEPGVPFRGAVVSAETGRPVSEVEVHLSKEGDFFPLWSFRPIESTITDSRGRFEAVLEPGKWCGRLVKEGYVSPVTDLGRWGDQVNGALFSVGEDSGTETFRLSPTPPGDPPRAKPALPASEPALHRLRSLADEGGRLRADPEARAAPHTLRGRVTLSTGEPVVGAVISAEFLAGEPLRTRVEATATGPDGSYELPLPGAPETSGEVNLRANGLRPSRREIRFPATGETRSRSARPKAHDVTKPLEFVLPAPGAVKASLTFAGLPPEDIRFWTNNRSRSHPGYGRAVYDPRRRTIELRGLLAGRHHLRLTVDGYAPRWFEVDIEEGRTIQLGTVALTEGGRVVGRILDPEGRPVTRANIGRTGLDWQLWTPTDHDGNFVLENVPPGSWTLTVNAMAWTPKYMSGFRVEVEEGRSSEVLCRITYAQRR